MIEVKSLTKNFGAIKAVNDVSFNVEKGEILGFLGPNGAGKSTTMRMITGFIPPTSGTALVGGCDIIKDSLQARGKIGYLPENAPVYPDMSVSGYLDFCAEIRGFSKTERKNKVNETIEKCFLKKVEFQSIGTLSKGYKQRVCFAQSIIHDPEYLIFDEPTDGLDPNQKHEVRLMIREMSRKKAILLSTHILDEVEAVCTRIIIIANGRIAANDSPDNLKTKSSVYGTLSLKVAGIKKEALLSSINKISEVKSADIIDEKNNLISLRIYPKDAGSPMTGQIISKLREEGCRIESLFVEQGRLDEVFRNITMQV